MLFRLSVKYEYAYKTSDGLRHVEEMDAPSREAVFIALRARYQGHQGRCEGGWKGQWGSDDCRRQEARGVRPCSGGDGCGSLFHIGVNEEKETATPSQTVVTNTVPVPVVISSPAVKVRQRVAAPLPRQIIQGDRRFDIETYCHKVKTLRYIAISDAFDQK